MASDRYGCAAFTKSGTCANGVTISRASVERRVLGALQDRMLAPELVGAFVEPYQTEIAADRLKLERQAAADRHELEDVTRRLAGVVDAMERGGWSPALQARPSELEARKARIEAALPGQSQAAAPVVLHPAATAETYRAKGSNLVTALTDPEVQGEAGEALRALIDHVRMVPDAAAPNRHHLELHGDLAMVLHVGTSANGSERDNARSSRGIGRLAETGALASQLSVVAGTRCISGSTMASSCPSTWTHPCTRPAGVGHSAGPGHGGGAGALLGCLSERPAPLAPPRSARCRPAGRNDSARLLPVRGRCRCPPRIRPAPKPAAGLEVLLCNGCHGGGACRRWPPGGRRGRCG